MTEPITRRRGIESLKTAARWPGADRNTTVILAARLAAARTDAEGYRYFSELADAQPGEALPLALAGFFPARLGAHVDAALAKLDQAGFPAGLDRQQGDRPPFRYFTGAAGSVPPAVVPDQLISQPTPLTAGGTELVLYPTPGGETTDALMVHLPASGVLFAGDVLMPYLGQPFAAEGSPEGLLEALAFIGTLRPRLLIHGHPTLTELFTAEAIPGLQAALTQLHGEALDRIRDGRTLPDIL